MQCACGSGAEYENCCGRYLSGEKSAETAEQLLRSRFTAYVRNDADYILKTIHPDKRSQYDEKAISDWSAAATTAGVVVACGGPILAARRAAESGKKKCREGKGAHGNLEQDPSLVEVSV